MVSKQLFTALFSYGLLFLRIKGLKSLSNFDLFKLKLKLWEYTEYPCKLCKNYIKNIAYA